MIDLCKKIADKYPNTEIEIIIGEQLLKKDFMLYMVLEKALINPPALVTLKYNGNPAHPEDLYGIVGKGVCFDTGGYNLKASGSIELMYLDKCGAGAVIGAFRGVVE